VKLWCWLFHRAHWHQHYIGLKAQRKQTLDLGALPKRDSRPIFYCDDSDGAAPPASGREGSE